MQRLTSRLRRRLAGERGASAVLVGLLMVPLLGMGAIAVDVAAVYAERRQLQNGADAAALAIGQDCAEGACGATQTTADTLTTANYKAAGSTHGTPVVTLGASEVTVDNPGVQSHWLAPVFGLASSDVTASATVRWGAPGSGTAVLPLAFSWCAFNAQTGGGLPTGTDPILIEWTKTDGSTCTGPSGLQVPGGFGWLATDAGECGATTAVDGIVPSSPGASVPAECTPAYFQSLLGETVLLPIFDEASGTGAGASYRIYAYAAFTITGYNFAGQYYSSPKPCTGQTRCIKGFFTEFVDPSAAFVYDPSAPDLGARVVSLVR